MNQLALLERGIEEELGGWDVRVNIEVEAPKIERIFEIGTELHLIEEGVRTSAERKGHGLQRALMFALLKAWVDVLHRSHTTEDGPTARKQSESVVFAIEEPELFLHPHAQRRMAKTLRELSGVDEHQVFICTHSTQFVDLNYYQDISIITKPDPELGTIVRQRKTDIFSGHENSESKKAKKSFDLGHWLNPDRAAMFFAEKVVFVEGPTEKVNLPYLAERLGIFNSEISIIDCSSKFSLPVYIMLAQAFDIPYLVVHDEDPLPDPFPSDWKEDRRKSERRTFGMNKRIADLVKQPLGDVEVVKPDFEKMSGISVSQGEKKGKPLAAIDHFEELPNKDIPSAVKQLVAKVYSLDE